MTGWPFQTKTRMMRAERLVKNLRALLGHASGRAFVCLCLLLPFHVAPEHELRTSSAGMDAPPPPTLESSHRFGTFGGLERRLLGGPSVTSGLWVPGWAWWVVIFQPARPDLAPTKLAELQQWRLEGG